MQEEYISLANLHGGGAIELFDRELRRILENIQDPNVKKDQVRTISLQVKIKPNEAGDFAVIEYGVTSKPAPVKSQTTQAYLSLRPGHLVATEYNPQQNRLAFEAESDGKVVSINGRA